MRESIIGEKTFKFAVKIVNVYKDLAKAQNEYVLSKQLLRAGTSIGANIREALEAQSKRDFLSKSSIALKEAVETEYWIELMKETGFIDLNTAEELLNEVKEIIRIINKIIITTKSNLKIDK